MIKVSNKDSIIDIIKKIENSKKNDIVLEFPVGNSILHNYTSLKVLKNKTPNKNLIIVTHDTHAKQIGRDLGIKYTILKDERTIKNIDLLHYNYTFKEYLIYLVKNYLKELKSFIFIKKGDSRYDKLLTYKYLKTEQGKISFFLGGLIISIFLFLFIFYFAVNITYITITPEILIKTRAKNFTFKEFEPNSITEQDEIKLNKISKLIYLKETFSTSGIYNDDSSLSKGEATIYNFLNEPLKLAANTRMQTGSGITLLIDKKIFIPRSQEQEGNTTPGTLNVNIIAKPKDIYGGVVGEKGNINKGELLFFPGLGKNLKSKVYAQANEIFTGGTNQYIKVITEKDIENAKNLLEEKLKHTALKEIQKQIRQENSINNTHYEILGIDNIIRYSDFKIIGEDTISVGEKRNNFELSGTIKITTYTYDKISVINKLKNSIRENLFSEVESINFINNESLRISNLISKIDDPINVRTTAEMEVFYSHNFLSQENSDIEKLKHIIVGLDKKNARDILINNPKISNVTIQNRPFFIKTITKIPKNIIFKVSELNK